MADFPDELISVLAQRLRYRTERKHVRRKTFHPRLETLEDRRLLAVTLTGSGTWVEQGPGVIFNGQVEGITNQPVAGAIQTMVVGNGKVYAGTVNGGVWTTSNISAENPDWTPRTDMMESLSIGAMATSSFNNQLVVAGTGSFSNGGGVGGRSVGVYVSEDGGNSWQHRGRNTFLDLPIRSLAVTGDLVDVILAGTDFGVTTKPAGLYRSFDLGRTWSQVSGTGGLPTGDVSDIEVDPGIEDDPVTPGDQSQPRTAYVAFPGQGVYRSTDLATWTRVNMGLTGIGASINIQLSLHRSGTTNVVYAGLVQSTNSVEQLSGVFRSTDRGANWTSHGGGLPTTSEVDSNGNSFASNGVDDDGDRLTDAADPDRDAGLHPGGQGKKNFSLVASSRKSDVVYVGGDRQPNALDAGNSQGCSNFSGRLFRGNNTSWSSIVCSAANNTSPHADSRFMVYVQGESGEASDFILQADDAGIYRLRNPEATAGAATPRQWDSRLGNSNALRITEINSVAYDSIHDIFFSGNQDTGASEQSVAGSLQWNQNLLGTLSSVQRYQQGDGDAQAFNIDGGIGFRYSMGNNLLHFYRRRFDNVNGTLTQFDLPPLGTEAAGQDYLSQQIIPNLATAGVGAVDQGQINPPKSCYCPTPIEFNKLASASNLLLLGYASLYESNDRGNTLSAIESPPLPVPRKGLVSAIAYGGRGVDASGVVVGAPEVMYVARGGNIAVRQAGTTFGSPLSNPNGFKVSNNVIRDIVMNPDEWRVAYAIDDQNIYRTKSGTNGTDWEQINLGNLADLTTELFSIEIYNPSSNPDDEVLLVGARGGVFFSRNPRSSTPTWQELEGGPNESGRLPNVAVKDVRVDAGMDRTFNTADDLIYVGTFGRGVWRLNQPQNALFGDLIVNGTTLNDTITLKLHDKSANALLDVIVNGVTETITYRPQNFIRINGLAGDDTIVIDSSNGVIGIDGREDRPELILIDGGSGNDELQLGPNDPSLTSTTAGPDATGTGAAVIRGKGLGGRLDASTKVSFNGLETIDSQIPNNRATKTGLGLRRLINASKTAQSKGGDLGFGNVVSSLSGTALRSSGRRANDPASAIAQRGIVRDGLGEIAGQFFESLTFSLDDVGTTVLDPALLRQRLDELDFNDGNVSMTDENGVLRFDIEIEKQVSGISLLDLGIEEGAFAGLVSLEGGLTLTADATLRLVLGVDASGDVFLDPLGAVDATGDPIPFISLGNVQGTADGQGRIGFLETQLTAATITTDPDLAVNIFLTDPNPSDADAMIRLADLDLQQGEIFSVNVTASPGDGQADISLAATFSVDLFGRSLFTDRQLTIQWPDANKPRQGILLPGNGDNALLDTLVAGVSQITTGIAALSDSIEQATGTNILATKIPLLNKTLGELIDGEAEPLTITPAQVFKIGSPQLDDSAQRNEVAVRTIGLDLLKAGLSVGAQVSFQSQSGSTVIGSLTAMDASGFVVSFMTNAAAPAANSEFTIKRSAGLADRLRAFTDGVAFQIPTIQELIDHLADVTGLESIRNVQVVGTLGNADFGIQFPIQYIPDAIQRTLPLDFGDRIAGLKLDASATASVTIAPEFNLTIGIHLAKTKADGSDFTPLERVFALATHDPTPTTGEASASGNPLATIGVKLQLDNPLVQGRVGFLDVTLAEDASVTANDGIQLDFIAALQLIDPDTGAADQRISIQDVTTQLSNVIAFDFDGFLDIDGLKLSAAVGDQPALASVTVALEGDGGDTAAGHFESLAELGQVLGRIQVSSFVDFDRFRNISAADVLAALELLVERLQATGRGGVFDRQIPLVNRSASDLIDLGQVFFNTIGEPESDGAIATAAKLEAFLNSKLGSATNPDVVDVSVNADAIMFEFAVGRGFAHTLPLSLSVTDRGVAVDGTADVTVTACGTLNLALGVLTAPGLAPAERFFIDTSAASPSGVSVDLRANAGYNNNPVCGGATVENQQPIDLDAVVGPLGLHVEDARVLIGLNLAANLQTAAADRRIRLSHLDATSIQPILSGSVQAIIPLDGNNDGSAAANPANLRAEDALVILGGRFDDVSDLVPTFLSDPLTSQLASQTNPATPIPDAQLPSSLRIETYQLNELISNSLLNFGTLIEGLERLLEWGDRVLGRDFLDRKIPFLGKSVRDGLNFLESDQPGAKTLRTVIQALIDNGSGGLGGNTSHAEVDTALNTLRSALAGIPGVAPIANQDFNGDGKVNTDDLVVAVKSGQETLGAFFRFRYAPSFTTNRPFDLGFDFLNLQAQGDVALNGQLGLTLGFGLTKDEGFFLITDLPGPEFTIGGSIQSSAALSAKLGFLDVDLALQPGTNMSVAFTMDVVDPSNNGKLTLGELLDFSRLPDMVPENNVHLTVETHVRATMATAINRDLPSISAGLLVDWGLPDPTQSDGFRGLDLLHLNGQNLVPAIEIQNIVLDVGSFLTSVVKPIFVKIQDLVPPKLRDQLDQKLPLIDRRVKDLLQDVIDRDQDPQRQRVFQLVLNTSVLLAQAESNVEQAKSHNLKINFGNIDVTPSADNPQRANPNVELQDSQVKTSQNGVLGGTFSDQTNTAGLDVPGSGLPVVGNFLAQLGEVGIFFPFLRLSNLSQLIVGNDIDLVFIDAPELSIEKVFDVAFPLLGGGLGDIVSLSVNAFLAGGFEFRAQLSGGFDTTGLRKGRFVDGFYLGDFDPGNNGQIEAGDVARPEIQFTAFVQAGVVGEAEVLGFDVGRIEGYFKIVADINIDLNDDNEINGVAPSCDRRSPEERHDGKLHVDEMRIIANSHDGKFLSILELEGELYGELGLHITVFNGRLYDERFFARFDLLSFDDLQFPVKCPPSGSGDSCTSDSGLATPRPSATDGLFDIEISPQDLAESDPDTIFAGLQDLNGMVFDGGGINTYDGDELVIDQILGGAFQFRHPAPIGGRAGGVEGEAIATFIPFRDQGLAVGQGITFTVNGRPKGGVITSVTDTFFHVDEIFGDIPPVAVGDQGQSLVTVFSPAETLIIEQNGFVDLLGPLGCGGNNIPGTSAVASITTGPNGLGPGNDTFRASRELRIPLKIDGGDGNDVIVAGIGPAILIGGRGNDVLRGGEHPLGRPNPAGVFFAGGAGRDLLVGGRGNDTLLGGEGDDAIYDDRFGVPENEPTDRDNLVGGGGHDAIVSRGNDELVGDYHATHDPRPITAGDQKEDIDFIRHASGGSATIFGDNRGLLPGEPGPTPNATLNTHDKIQAKDDTDEIFSDFGDQVAEQTGKGFVKVSAAVHDVVISAQEVAAQGTRPLLIGLGNTVEITDASGTLFIASDTQGTTVTASANDEGLTVVFVDGPTYKVHGVTELHMLGDAGNDTLVLDFSAGNPIPIDGASFLGQASLKAGGDQIRILGSGRERISFNPSQTAKSGSFSADERRVSFSNLTMFETELVDSVTWITSDSSDVLGITAATGSGNQPAAIVAGRSGGAASPSWRFFDVSSIVVSTFDTSPTVDRISFDTSVLLARGLQNMTLITGAGNDVVTVTGADLRLPESSRPLTIDTGLGADQLFVTGNVDMTLNGDTNTLFSSQAGTIQLRGLSTEEVQLTGGADVNRFIVTNWPGTARLDGAAGNDTLVLATRGGTVTTVDELTLAANVLVNPATLPATLAGRVNLGTTARTFSVANGAAATDLLIDAVLSGPAGLTKTGAGSMRMIQNNSFTGMTTISSGNLFVDGSQAAAVNLNGGTLGGNGSVGATTGTRGTLSPGSSPGRLTVRGPLTLTSQNMFRAELNGTAPGTGFDVVSVIGSVNLGGSQLLATATLSFPGRTYTIIDNDGTDSIVGTFAGLPEAATFVASGFTFRVSYRGGTGNDVVLTHLSNSAPAFQDRTITPLIDEGGTVVVSGTITEPDTGDLFTLVVDWRDGSPVEEFHFDPSERVDVSVQHRFSDNFDDHPGSNLHSIDLTWHDQHGASNSATEFTTIQNVAPTIRLLQRITGSGAVLRAVGGFTDPGSDSSFAMVDYGDGSGVMPLPLSSDGSFELSHQYTQAGTHTVQVHVTDDDGDSGTLGFPVVTEVGPDGVLLIVNPNRSIVLTGSGEILSLADPLFDLFDVEVIDIRGTGDNLLILDAERIRTQRSGGIVKVIADPGDQVVFDENWQFVGASINDGQLIRRFEHEGAIVDLVGPQSFTNPINEFDVNASGEITAGDAIQIINELKNRLFSDGTSTPFGAIGDLNAIDLTRFRFFDVSGDGYITSLDAIRIINQLARQTNLQAASGERNPVQNSKISAVQRDDTVELLTTVPPKKVTRYRGPSPADSQPAVNIVKPAAKSASVLTPLSALLVDAAIEELWSPRSWQHGA